MYDNHNLILWLCVAFIPFLLRTIIYSFKTLDNIIVSNKTFLSSYYLSFFVDNLISPSIYFASSF